MNQPLVNLRVDFAFKQLFGVQGQEELLISFLNAILQESLSTPIVSLKLKTHTSIKNMKKINYPY